MIEENLIEVLLLLLNRELLDSCHLEPGLPALWHCDPAGNHTVVVSRCLKTPQCTCSLFLGRGLLIPADVFILPLLLLLCPLQILSRDPVVVQAPCRQDQLLAGAAVFEGASEGCVSLELLDESLQF